MKNMLFAIGALTVPAAMAVTLVLVGVPALLLQAPPVQGVTYNVTATKAADANPYPDYGVTWQNLFPGPQTAGQAGQGAQAA